MAKPASLYLHKGQWEDMQLIDPQWVDDSTTEQVQKEDASGYGYLWTVYPEAGHYAALGLGGQQIHVYPSRNLIVVVTASLESYAEAPEIEKMLNKYILPAIKSDGPLENNPDDNSRLLGDIEIAANPARPVLTFPATASTISGSVYTFKENPLGWETLEFDIEAGMKTIQLHLNDYSALEMGLDNIYRLSRAQPFGEILLRGQWMNEHTFVIDYPYPLTGATILGELGEIEIQFNFSGTNLEVTARQLVFGGEPIVVEGVQTLSETK